MIQDIENKERGFSSIYLLNLQIFHLAPKVHIKTILFRLDLDYPDDKIYLL